MKTDENTEAKVEVHCYIPKEDKTELVASGVLKMIPDVVEKRVILKN